jgi:hypothetical protein
MTLVSVPFIPVVCPSPTHYLVRHAIGKTGSPEMIYPEDPVDGQISFCGPTPVADAVGVGVELYVEEGDTLIRGRFKLVLLHQMRAFRKMPTICMLSSGAPRSAARFRVHPDTSPTVSGMPSLHPQRGHIEVSISPPVGYKVVQQALSAWYELRGHGLKPSPSFWKGARGQADTGQSHEVSYCGVEFEADFHSMAAKGIAIQALLGYDYRSFADQAQHRLHVESDSSLGSNGFEAVTMPHSIGNGTTCAHPGTYKFLTDVMGMIKNYGAHNQQKLCGMHVHLSRTAGRSLRSLAPAKILDRLAAAYVYSAIRVDILGLIGRVEVSSFARPSNAELDSTTSNPSGSRYRHINWANANTVEFRFPGPFGFADPTWACKMVDVIRAMVMTADLVYDKYVQGTLSIEGQEFVEFAKVRWNTGVPYPAHYLAFTMHALGTVIQKQEHLFPYASVLMKQHVGWGNIMREWHAQTPAPAPAPAPVPHYTL